MDNIQKGCTEGHIRKRELQLQHFVELVVHSFGWLDYSGSVPSWFPSLRVMLTTYLMLCLLLDMYSKAKTAHEPKLTPTEQSNFVDTRQLFFVIY
ncbi:hypothetical protein PanWU01x14_300220 [Parasponia andersonii]|uniref:Uncharacterized protein n=1 Tax=Parasponia andersonii TaxID=3476 RepID=A0A2P5AU66_PARAD|nr:hypothetical protein PanWU01x14_300220 [Parasponia andersonii]